MGVQSLSHEIAFATSRRVLGVFAPLIREEEQLAAMKEVYPLVKAALRTFAERLDREHQRLHGQPPDAPVLADEVEPAPDTSGQGE